MAKGDHQYRGKPEGSTLGGYARPRVQIGFDDETREMIAAWAKHNGRSFTAEVRQLVTEGLSRRTR
jgi:Arc-like DNA binding domain